MALPIEKLRNPALRDFALNHLDSVGRIIALGAPVLADVDKVVTSTNMKVGAYTIAAQPANPVNITVSHTQVGGVTDTLGTITIVGTRLGQAVTEVITPLDGTTASGAKLFDAITSATGAGWVIDTTEDTITIGVGTVTGMPIALASTGDCVLSILGTAIIVPTTTAGGVEDSGIDSSSGTYDGSKVLYAIVIE